MYVDQEYAESRLHGTLVRANGRPVLVTLVREDLSCDIKDMVSGENNTVSLDELDLKSPPLGFVNDEGGCMYLSRRPMRNDWRQGVRTNSVVNQSLGGRRPSLELIAKCMLGEFPSRATTLRKLRDGVRGVAISRDFSLTRKGSRTIINYKWYGAVGKLTSKGAVLDSEWKYLMPLVKEVV